MSLKPAEDGFAFWDPATGERRVAAFPEDGCLELPAGTVIDGMLLLAPLWLSPEGQVGFRPGAAAAGTAYYASVLPLGDADPAGAQAAFGFRGRTSFRVHANEGRFLSAGFWLHMAARNGGVDGAVSGAEVPVLARLPVRCVDVNPRWAMGAWRPGEEIRPAQFFEGAMLARLDVSRSGAFYCGNLLIADDDNVYLAFASPWTADAPPRIEVTNPGTAARTFRVRTPRAITDRYAVDMTVNVPAGGSRVVEAEAPK
jgi:hypothetical protein